MHKINVFKKKKKGAEDCFGNQQPIPDMLAPGLAKTLSLHSVGTP